MGFLISDGVNDVVSLPSGCTSNAGNTAYTFWVKGVLRAAPAGLTGILGAPLIATSNGFAMNATLQLRVYTAGTNRYGTGDNFFEVGVYHHYRVEHDAGGDWRAYRDDMITPVASGSFTFSTVFSQLSQIFRSSNASTMYGAWDLDELGITSTTFNETYQADLSGGTGSILPTVSGNNNGSLVNFPTDGSQWGGFGAASSVAFNMPQMAVAAVASASSTGIAAAVAFTMPQMAVSAVGNTSIEAGAAFTMPQMAVAINGDVVATGNSASVNFTMPQMVVAATASSTVPIIDASISATMPQLTVSVVADVQSLSVAANIAFSMPQMTVVASGSTVAPTISASASFTMPQMIVQAYSGGFAYFEPDGGHIELAAQSAHTETMAASTHLEYTNQSSHIEWRA